MLCESREDCSPPYVCAAGACVYPGTCGACTEASDCAPFSCNVSTSSCYTACIRLEDCAPGFACEGHQCVQAMPTPLAR